MKEINEEARDRYYAEVGIHLTRAGFTVLPQENGLLPLEWNGSSLCRLTAGGGAQYRASEMEPDGAQEAFHRAADIAAVTAEYMWFMEVAPQLRATGLDGDYRLLADFGGSVLAGHPTPHGAEFVTWEWDYEHTGMWQGHYYGNNYAGAKQDFAVRSGLFPRERFFTDEQLTDLYVNASWALENNGYLKFDDYRRVQETLEQIERLVPQAQEQAAEMKQQYNSISSL